MFSIYTTARIQSFIVHIVSMHLKQIIILALLRFWNFILSYLQETQLFG